MNPMLPKRFLMSLMATIWLIAAMSVGEEKKPQIIKGWGKVSDLDGDCTIKSEKGKVSITVPDKNHNLNPRAGMNAPRILQEIEGDFTVQVQVSGDFKPTDRSTLEGGRSFNGAGLLLWQDEKNYLRLERNSYRIPEQNLSVCYPPLLELYSDGQYMDTNPDPELDTFFKGRSTYLRLERQGDKVRASLSEDGKKWSFVKELHVDFPKKLRVGVAAINTSAEPFKVEFDELKITSK
jgi:regulation of enolase protein 1 (concanavalin A-like superfamily)